MKPHLSYLHRLGRAAFLCAERLADWEDRRRQRHCLATLDGRMLADAGISRSEAAEEAAKPFWKP